MLIIIGTIVVNVLGVMVLIKMIEEIDCGKLLYGVQLQGFYAKARDYLRTRTGINP